MKKKAYVAASPLHRLRYIKNKTMGMSIEEIAKDEHVSILSIERSIQQVELQNSIFSVDTLESEQIEVIVSQKPFETKAINEALVATKNVYAETGDLAGQVIATEPDHDVRLKASDILTKKSGNVLGRHSKGNPQTLVQVNTGAAQVTGTSFEDRLREIKKRREQSTVSVQNELPAGTVIDIAPEKDKIQPIGDS